MPVVDGPILESSELISPELLSALRPQLHKGRMDGTRAEMFGEIGDIEVDDSGNVIVADHGLLEIKMFNKDGEFIDFAGGDGSGPGEFRFPGGMALSPSGDLLVADGGNRRLSRFSLSDSGFAHIEDINIPVLPTDICLVGERIFLNGAHQERVIHEVTARGELLQSFGALYPADDVPAWYRGSYQELMTVGYFACSPRHELIILAARNRPEIRAFSTDGKLQWRTILSDWLQLGVEELNRERPTMRMKLDPETGAVNRTVSAVILAPDHLLIQVIRADLSIPSEEFPATTRVLSLQTGEELFIIDEGVLPRLAKVTRGRAYGYTQLPYPQYLVLGFDRDQLERLWDQ